VRGYEVVRGAVPIAAVDDALRHLHLDLVRHGASAETLGEWLWGAHWFPHLRWDREIVALSEHLPAALRQGELCDPQIVLQPPDCGDVTPLEPHVDREPEWANGRSYARIVGVALSRSRASNGGLAVWPLDGAEVLTVELEQGDAIVMHPALPHASQRNEEGGIRYAVYFRYLEEKHPPASSLDGRA
jgi:Phytanoyl-CoA dioxygenase (PhyH)